MSEKFANNKVDAVDIEEEIRPKARQQENFKHLETDIETYLMPYADEFVLINCPACNGQASEKYFEKGQFQFWLCPGCKTVFVNPRPTAERLDQFYSQSKFFNGFMESLIENEKARIKHIFEPRARMILDHLKAFGIENGALLDVGCSIGTMLSVFQQLSEFDVYGLDPSQIAVDYCKKRGFDIFPTTIEEFDPEQKKFDVVFSFETIEHLFRPAEFVEKISRVLKPGGCFVFSTPNYHGFDIAILGRHYKRVMAPFHLNYFNIGTIDVILKPLGMQVVKKLTPGVLDTINVKKQIEEGLCPEIDPFIRYLLFETSEETQANFQNFLKENCLSSHMLIFALKQ